MKYLVPLTCNASREPVGVFSATSTKGAIVILFSNMATWKRFADAAAPVVRRSNEYLGSTTLEAATFQEAVGQLEQIQPNILDEAMFIPDTAPFVEDVIEFFKGQAQKM